MTQTIKRTTAALALSALLLCMLAACGMPGPSSSADSGSTVSAGTSAPPEAPEAAPDAPLPASSEPMPASTSSPVPWQDVTVLDDAICTLMITGIDLNHPSGHQAVDILFENKTADRTLTAVLQGASDCGIERAVEGPSLEAGPGGTVQGSVVIGDAQVQWEPQQGAGEENGISLSDLALTFSVAESGAQAWEFLAHETVHVYPMGEDHARLYFRVSQPEDVVLLDNDVLTLIMTGTSDGLDGARAVDFFVQNKTSHKLSVTLDEAESGATIAVLPLSGQSCTAGAML